MPHTTYTHEEVNIQTGIQSHYTTYEESNYLIHTHWHPHLEILYVQKGNLHVTIGEKEFVLPKGHIAVINSHEIHSTRCVELSKVLVLQIPCEQLKASIPDYEQIRFFSQPELGAGKSEELAQIILNLDKLYHSKPDGWQLKFQSLLYELLYELYVCGHESVSLAVKTKTERNLSRLELITDYAKAHYNEPVTLEEAAQVAGLNPEYFCRFFKKYMGVTFFTYMNTLRLSHVYEELLTTDYTITDILEHHGFTNYRVFMKMFKDTYGCTPLKKRKQHAKS